LLKSYPGQSELGQGAHHHQVWEFREPRHEGLARECVVSLVDHDEPGGRRDDLGDRVLGKQVAARVVRIGNEDHRRTVFGQRPQNGLGIEREVGLEQNPDIAQTGELRVKVEHEETGPGREHHGPRARHALDDDVNDLVRTVTEQHAVFGADHHYFPQPPHQCRRPGIGIAVDLGLSHGFGNLEPQGLGQPIWIFHRVELHHALGLRHVISAKRANLLADHLFRSGTHGLPLSVFPNLSAAERACA
jgi:hypothetical protein